MRLRQSLVCLTTLLGASSIAIPAAAAPAAPATSSAVFAPGSRPYGTPYARWAADWARWVLTGTEATAPLLHPERCGFSRSRRVWNLAAIPGGRKSARCAVPAGAALLITPSSVIINNAPANPSDPPDPPGGLRPAAIKSERTVRALSLTVDGHRVPHPRAYYVVSPLYTQKVGPGNLFGARPGRYVTVAVGYFFMIRPLPAGEHTVVALAQDPELKGGFARMSYRLSVG